VAGGTVTGTLSKLVADGVLDRVELPPAAADTGWSSPLLGTCAREDHPERAPEGSSGPAAG
jgi:hypothetical protein